MDLPKKKSHIAVYGLWHLGSVTAACLTEAGFSVIGLDEDPERIKGLSSGKAPLFEPGLYQLIELGITKKHLSFSDQKESLQDAVVIWITFDTPVDEEDRADTLYVTERIQSIFHYLQDQAILLISSQLPVGTTASLDKAFQQEYPTKTIYFAYSPENLRLGKAVDAFKNQERIVIGTRPDFPKKRLLSLLYPFAQNLLWITIESAEMSKHALNTFLALCVTYANELATICEQVGATASEVEQALRSEPRVGSKAFIKPGAAFGGGTLARDVNFLSEHAKKHQLSTSLIEHILESNNTHKNWFLNRLQQMLGDLNNKKIALLGLAYKPETSSTRHSVALHLCHQLAQLGAQVFAFDPKVTTLPDCYQSITLCENVKQALNQADALVIATEWPQFLKLTEHDFTHMKQKIIIDQTGFVQSTFGSTSNSNYFMVGKG